MRTLAELLPAEALRPSATVVGAGSATLGGTSRVLGREPESLVRPGSTEEVAAVLEWASREGVGVLPIASGCRAAPIRRDPPYGDRPYVVLSTERLSGIEIYEPADLTLTAGAGTPFREIDRALRAERQWTPFDPPFVTEWSLGGLVAMGESGPLWMGYGELRNHVLGATVVTGDGRRLRLGGRVVKNVAGYDVLKTIVGSRGTLGIITSVCVRAFPEPEVDRVLVLRGATPADLVGAACGVATAPVLPVSSVLVDGLVGEQTGPGESGAGSADRRAALVVRLHGALSTVDADQAALERHVGSTFQPASGDDSGGVGATGLLAAIRDRAAREPVVLDLSARPSRLRDVLELVAQLEPAGFVADTYAGRMRVGLPECDAGALRSAREAIERLGGVLRVVRDERGNGGTQLDTPPSDHEVRLTGSLRAAFDPEGVFWPARR